MANVAVTDCAADMMTVQTLPETVAHPVKPVKLPVVAVAVRVTVVGGVAAA